MNNYSFILTLLMTISSCTVFGSDFGDLLSRLNSRDFSAERDVFTGRGSVYVGELVNPHSETPMFKARDEFRSRLAEAQKTNNQEEIDALCTFIHQAMKEDISDETKVWLLSQLGIIGTDKDVTAIVELFNTPSARIVDGAAACLAKIPGELAQKALEENASLPAVSAALLSRNTTSIPYEGIETAMPQCLSNASDETVDEWLLSYDELDNWTKEVTLAALTVRNNKKYRPYALKALVSDSDSLKLAGFLSLEKLGTAEDVSIFIQYLKENRELAIRIASFVAADGFDSALLETIDQTDDPQLFCDLATILSNRAVDVRPRIFNKTTTVYCPNRLQLLQKVRAISTPDDVPSFVESITKMPRGKDRDAVENMIASLCNKNAEPILALIGKYPVQYNELLLSLVARTGGEAAKDTITKLLESSDDRNKSAGLQALNVWNDGQFADKMEQLLLSKSLSDTQRITLLRSYIRTISLPDDQIGIELSRDAKLEKLQKAYKLAERPDEKALVLSRLAANRTAKSFEYAIQCASEEDEQIIVAAHKAIADHIHDTILRKENPDLATKGINLILKNSKDSALIERVTTYKERLEQ